jgi:integrase/recombinase XerD
VTALRIAPPITITEYLESWRNVLEAENKAIPTRINYTTGVQLYIRWCQQRRQTPRIDRELVVKWVADMLASGLQANTVKGRQLAVRRFSAWMDGEPTIKYTDQLIGLKPPKSAEKLLEPLTDRELKLMLAACEGKALRDYRDEALLRLMVETGMRSGEILRLEVGDINTKERVILIRKAKAGRGRPVGFSPKAAVALDKYLRIRRAHAASAIPHLWLSENNGRLTYVGLRWTLTERAKSVGIERFHLHLMRHTAASRWLAAGGSEQGLMQTAGWKDRAMLDRYTRGTAQERALAEAQRLNLGDL